jgi:ATP-dependent Clp protease ATP-binding subunit ClpC
VEDPLAEELLKGSFQGNNKIVVDAIRDEEGKIRRLDFRGETVQSAEPETDEPVAAGVGDADESAEADQDA